jgi:hypothetical protein
MPLFTEERYWALFYMPLYKFFTQFAEWTGTDWDYKNKSVSRLSSKHGSLDVSRPYWSQQPVISLALYIYMYRDSLHWITLCCSWFNHLYFHRACEEETCLVAVKDGHEMGTVEPTTAWRLCLYTYIMTGWLCWQLQVRTESEHVDKQELNPIHWSFFLFSNPFWFYSLSIKLKMHLSSSSAGFFFGRHGNERAWETKET